MAAWDRGFGESLTQEQRKAYSHVEGIMHCARLTGRRNALHGLDLSMNHRVKELDKAIAYQGWRFRIALPLSSLGASWRCFLFHGIFKANYFAESPCILRRLRGLSHWRIFIYIYMTSFLCSLQAMLHSGSGTQALCVLDVYPKLVQVASRQTPSRPMVYRLQKTCHHRL